MQRKLLAVGLIFVVFLAGCGEPGPGVNGTDTTEVLDDETPTEEEVDTPTETDTPFETPTEADDTTGNETGNGTTGNETGDDTMGETPTPTEA